MKISVKMLINTIPSNARVGKKLQSGKEYRKGIIRFFLLYAAYLPAKPDEQIAEKPVVPRILANIPVLNLIPKGSERISDTKTFLRLKLFGLPLVYKKVRNRK